MANVEHSGSIESALTRPAVQSYLESFSRVPVHIVKLERDGNDLCDLDLARCDALCGDRRRASVIAPFLAFRGPVVANPLWYPRLETRIRRQLISFVRGVLVSPRFEPQRVNEYCDG